MVSVILKSFTLQPEIVLQEVVRQPIVAAFIPMVGSKDASVNCQISTSLHLMKRHL